MVHATKDAVQIISQKIVHTMIMITTIAIVIVNILLEESSENHVAILIGGIIKIVTVIA